MHSVKKKMWLLPARINWWPEPASQVRSRSSLVCSPELFCSAWKAARPALELGVTVG